MDLSSRNLRGKNEKVRRLANLVAFMLHQYERSAILYDGVMVKLDWHGMFVNVVDRMRVEFASVYFESHVRGTKDDNKSNWAMYTDMLLNCMYVIMFGDSDGSEFIIDS